MSQKYEATGKLSALLPTKSVGAKGFLVREFVLDIPSKYPQSVLFQVTSDDCAKMDAFPIGTVLDVSFDLRGREWTSPKDGTVRYFNSLNVWRLSRAAGASEPPPIADADQGIPF